MFGWLDAGMRILFGIGIGLVLLVGLYNLVRSVGQGGRVQVRARVVAKEREELMPALPTPSGAPIIRHVIYAEVAGKRYRMTVPAELWADLAEGQEVLLQTEEKRHVTGFRPV
jgi:hypothetical protein